MSKTNHIEITIKSAQRIIRAMCLNALKTGKTPQNIFMHGTMGVGKSAIVEQTTRFIEKQMGVKTNLIDLRLSAMEPADVLGIPYTGVVGANKMVADGIEYVLEEKDMFFSTPSWWPKNDDEFYVLFLDEFSNCSKSVQHAAYRLIQERSIQNGKKLGKNVIIISAGNLASDKTGAKPVLPAAANRFGCHLYIDAHSKDAANAFIEWGMNEGKIHKSVISYINYDHTQLCTDPDGEAFARPRTWEAVSEHLYNEEFTRSPESSMIIDATIGGAVGQAVATKFLSYLDLSKYLPDWEAIRKGKLEYKLPEKREPQFAVITPLAFEFIDALLKDQTEDIKNLVKVLDQFEDEFHVLFVRTIRYNEDANNILLKIIRNPDIGPIMTRLIQKVNGK